MAKHDLGDMEVIRAKLEGWLRVKLPDAEQLTLGTLSFPEESGESSVSLIVNADNRGEEMRFICRMKPRDSEVFADHDLQLQYDLMAMAGENDIPVPPLLGFEPDATLLDSDFYIMGFVEGRVPTDNPPYAFGSWVTELSDEERRVMWKNGIETLAKIHQINLEAYDISRIPCSDENDSPAQHEIDKFNALITDDIMDALSPDLMRAVRHINEHAPAGGPRRLCWGDSRVGNMIWKNLKPSAVIDWEMAGIGDPLQDVSWWYWIDYVNSVGLGLERLDGLPTLAEVYEKWHLLTGLPTDHANYYDLFTLVRYAIILEKKFVALKKAGLGTIDNFCVPFVEQQLKICESM
ncbi:MAG: phosphotransferase family protein [Halieaceae bacterium]|jgi:aminoglycoside phosphotransferase (APT) family kinase protein|nr:phosphotransferase family protein [Halieaceae bacterium]